MKLYVYHCYCGLGNLLQEKVGKFTAQESWGIYCIKSWGINCIKKMGNLLHNKLRNFKTA